MTGVESVLTDIGETPLSKYGSHLAVAREEESNVLIVHNVRRKWGEDVAFRVHFEKDGGLLEIGVAASPWAMRVDCGSPGGGAGSARIYLRGDDAVVIECSGCDVVLTQACENGYGIRETDVRCRMVSVPHRYYATVDVFSGELRLDGPQRAAPDDRMRNHRQRLVVRPDAGPVLLQLEIAPFERRAAPAAPEGDQEIARVRAEWTAFLRTMPAVPRSHRLYSEMAWYTLWSCYVRAEGSYAYDAILMAKKGMCSIWTWDHCFNALALARADKDAALRQFLLPFEVQSVGGALPDYWSPNAEIVWGVTKPPIHGWCFEKLMDLYDFDQQTLRKVYGHLERWTLWWMECRDADGDGIPDYPQSCDSGWDNSALFHLGCFLESPDLSAYLVLQMRALARIAGTLGNAGHAASWNTRAEELLRRFIAHSWNGQRFVAKLSGSHEFDEHPLSSQALVPLLLGSLIDADKRDRLAVILENEFLTDNGFANNCELRDGVLVRRGGIWASIHYIFVDGLRRSGHVELARRAARAFCSLIENKVRCHYEGFYTDGRKRGVPGYTWTAAVYLLLVWEYPVR